MTIERPFPVRLRTGEEVPYGRDCNCESCVLNERGPLLAETRYDEDGDYAGRMCDEAWELSRFNPKNQFE